MVVTKKCDMFSEHSKIYLQAGLSSSGRWNRNFQRAVYFKKGEGAYIHDMDDNKLIDMSLSHGASLLGHNNKAVNDAIAQALEMGILCSYETEYQTMLAEEICSIIPSAEVCRFACSGTEAVMHAIRLARAVSGKSIVLKFEGHYHGLCDYVQYSWSPKADLMGSYENPESVELSTGIPAALRDLIKIIPFNNPDILKKTIEDMKDSIAAVILEPINYNQGCIVPEKGFLNLLRELTSKNDILLIFDEVLSAFRTGPDCAQGYYGVTPDISVIGKSLGGGTPITAIAGKRNILEHFQPTGSCTHTGTYNGHLISTMAALATINEVKKLYFYDHIYTLADKFYSGLDEIFSASRLNIKAQGLGARFGFYFDVQKDVVKEYRDRIGENEKMALKFYQLLYEKGIYFHGLHNGFSIKHSLHDIEQVLDCIEKTVKELEFIF